MHVKELVVHTVFRLLAFPLEKRGYIELEAKLPFLAAMPLSCAPRIVVQPSCVCAKYVSRSIYVCAFGDLLVCVADISTRTPILARYSVK